MKIVKAIMNPSRATFQNSQKVLFINKGKWHPTWEVLEHMLRHIGKKWIGSWNAKTNSVGNWNWWDD